MATLPAWHHAIFGRVTLESIPTKWWVVGCSGSGKSTLAHHLASQLDLSYHELDATFHQPGWTTIPEDEFVRRVKGFVVSDAWIIDGNYRQVQEVVFENVQAIVAFDLSRSTIMRRVIGRTLIRAWHRHELWNGNREKVRNLFAWNPEKSIIRWAWTSYDRRVEHATWLEKVAKERDIWFFRVQSTGPTSEVVDDIFRELELAS